MMYIDSLCTTWVARTSRHLGIIKIQSDLVSSPKEKYHVTLYKVTRHVDLLRPDPDSVKPTFCKSIIV